MRRRSCGLAGASWRSHGNSETLALHSSRPLAPSVVFLLRLFHILSRSLPRFVGVDEMQRSGEREGGMRTRRREERNEKPHGRTVIRRGENERRKIKKGGGRKTEDAHKVLSGTIGSLEFPFRNFLLLLLPFRRFFKDASLLPRLYQF